MCVPINPTIHRKQVDLFKSIDLFLKAKFIVHTVYRKNVTRFAVHAMIDAVNVVGCMLVIVKNSVLHIVEGML